MGYIKKEDILGYSDEHGVYCFEHGPDYRDMNPDNIITENQIDDDDLYHCDTCGRDFHTML